MKLLDMKQDYIEHTHAAEGIYLKAAAEKRDYTPQEQRDYDAHITKATQLDAQIKAESSRPAPLRAAKGGDFSRLIDWASPLRSHGFAEAIPTAELTAGCNGRRLLRARSLQREDERGHAYEGSAVRTRRADMQSVFPRDQLSCPVGFAGPWNFRCFDGHSNGHGHQDSDGKLPSERPQSKPSPPGRLPRSAELTPRWASSR